MMYFNKDLCEKALEIAKESHDLFEVAKDINRIEYVLSDAKSIENLQKARMLDYELREKYPTIDKMIAIANGFLKISANSLTRSQRQDNMDFLKQDYYGILCDTLLKKRITTSIEQFIEKVD